MGFALKSETGSTRYRNAYTVQYYSHTTVVNVECGIKYIN
jgi:hypothetical protein